MASKLGSDTVNSPAGEKSKKPRKKKPGAREKQNGLSETSITSKLEDEVEDLKINNTSSLQPPTTPRSNDDVNPVYTNGDHPTNGSHSLPTQVNDTGSSSSPRSPTTQPQATTDTSKSRTDSPLEMDQHTEARLEALASERAALRDEVTQLRISLQEIQEQHQQELGNTRIELEASQGDRDQAQHQYQSLVEKVNTFKSQLGDRLKEDAEVISQKNIQIEELEEQKSALKQEVEARTAEVSVLAEESERRSKELSSLRNRMTLSQQNWEREREDMQEKEAYTKREFEAAKQAMQDWEVLAMEERSHRDHLAERVSDLEEQLASQREAYEKAAAERDGQSLTVDGLQRAMKEIQDARKRELRELVENSQAQVKKLRQELEETQTSANGLKQTLETTAKDLARVLPFEVEVKEKNLLIMKLRHEAVTLNEHLTKAFKQLKRNKTEDTIDKQLVTNHFLHFISLERTDPRKFQVLQIIAAILGWDEEQHEKAGLARPGASNPNLRAPISPWYRTPSTPSLTADYLPEARSRGESVGGMFQEFLDREARGTSTTGRSSRSTSVSSAMRSTAP